MPPAVSATLTQGHAISATLKEQLQQLMDNISHLDSALHMGFASDLMASAVLTELSHTQ
ncbi:hypothetical protein DACRYDRAFT_107140 [Dacryopinax primogenitus]|uniref:Uncharacterized protein n=1 Tax=Dacryopinax primogenitus (strain DJM 731) TaxID=1858805 RepID=M5G0E8_DACPD|nr:uncharacterized protein DACRYDRAFT_107140 [Dacryopinax primogenitus]EJU02204.1 hypothetical protein DACRYDRAFT_107140 [Dacryopinax primogenitus]